MKIIGITGKMRDGKSYAAKTIVKILHESNKLACILPFAKGVKDFAYNLGWNGIKDAKGRRLLQLIGTDCGRDCISFDIWVDKWLEQYYKIKRDNPNIIVIADDVRFLNEAVAINNMGGFIIKVEGKKSVFDIFKRKHRSENGISKSCIKYIVDNKEKNHDKLVSILRSILIRENL